MSSHRPRGSSSRGIPRGTLSRAGRRTRIKGACIHASTQHTRPGLRIRDLARSSAHDPPTSINSARAPPSVFVIAAPSVAIPVSRRTCPFRVRADEHDRQHRPECVCAGLEHLRPRNAKRETEGSETPTSMHGGPPEYGWVEMRSARRKEIAEVQRARGGGAGSAKTLG